MTGIQLLTLIDEFSRKTQSRFIRTAKLFDRIERKGAAPATIKDMMILLDTLEKKGFIDTIKAFHYGIAAIAITPLGRDKASHPEEASKG